MLKIIIIIIGYTLNNFNIIVHDGIYIYIYTHKFQILKKVPFFGFRVPTWVLVHICKKRCNSEEEKRIVIFIFKKMGFVCQIPRLDANIAVEE